MLCQGEKLLLWKTKDCSDIELFTLILCWYSSFMFWSVISKLCFLKMQKKKKKTFLIFNLNRKFFLNIFKFLFCKLIKFCSTLLCSLKLLFDCPKSSFCQKKKKLSKSLQTYYLKRRELGCCVNSFRGVKPLVWCKMTPVHSFQQ